jgi:hypothetical protein
MAIYAGQKKILVGSHHHRLVAIRRINRPNARLRRRPFYLYPILIVHVLFPFQDKLEVERGT